MAKPKKANESFDQLLRLRLYRTYFNSICGAVTIGKINNTEDVFNTLDCNFLKQDNARFLKIFLQSKLLFKRMCTQIWMVNYPYSCKYLISYVGMCERTYACM